MLILSNYYRTGVILTMMVKDCMQSEVVFISVPGTREDVLQMMAEKQVNGVPIVKKGTMSLVGIVTRTDLLTKADENQLAMLMNRDPDTVTPRTDLKTATKMMIEKNYRRLPVVEKGNLVGMISIPDILGATLENNEEIGSKEIVDFITREITAVWEQTPLPLTYMIMDMAGKNALVLINEGGGVSGMITVSDYIRLSEVTVEDNISKTFSGQDSSVEWGWTSKDFLVVTKKLLKLPNIPVAEAMTKNIISLSEITTISEFVKTIRKEDIDQAPVLSVTGNLLGMIEDRNLLQLALEVQKD
jgi:CBS domain-containing protein